MLAFWQYGFSNLNSNILRGTLAEFIIESALKEKGDINIHNPWGDFDIEYMEKKIEVKCSSYLQDWDQEKHTTISWTGLKARNLYWSSAVTQEKSSENTSDYKADIYVLSLVNHKKTDTLDILDLNQWEFYILSRDKIREISNNGKSLSLSKLNKNNISSTSYRNIKKAIDLI